MKLAILSCGPNSYSTRSLEEAPLQRGYDVKVLNTLKFAIDLQGGDPDLYFRPKPLTHYDAVLPRVAGGARRLRHWILGSRTQSAIGRPWQPIGASRFV